MERFKRSCTASVLVAAALVLGACSSPSGGDAAESSAATNAAAGTQASATATADGTQAATEATAEIESTKSSAVSVSTDRYRIDIKFPQLKTSESALQKAVKADSDALQAQFKQALPDPGTAPEFANRQLSLDVTYSVASRVARFTSVRGTGSMDTGGAHPMPLSSTFVLDTKTGKVIGIEDLFADPAKGLETLSAIARKDLLQQLMAQKPGEDEGSPQALKEWTANMKDMVADGTKPEAVNFSQFIVLAGADDKASGLALIFPPYQVAPYVYGRFTVDVPAKALADVLKPAYRTAFGLPQGG